MTDVGASIEQLRAHGWRQGSILPAALFAAACDAAAHQHPHLINVQPDDWLIVVSHSCDVRNRGKVENEPTIEVLVARPHRGKPHSGETHGKVSRRLQLKGEQDGAEVNLAASAHDRFRMDRLLLSGHPPDSARVIGRADSKGNNRELQGLIAWIAKRYQRQAFPDEFDAAVSSAKARDAINGFLINHSKSIVGVFIAFADRVGQRPRFHVEFRLALRSKAIEADWPAQKQAIEDGFEALWQNVEDVTVDVVAIIGNQLSVEEIVEGRFQKFDRDWISYEQDPEAGPAPDV